MTAERQAYLVSFSGEGLTVLVAAESPEEAEGLAEREFVFEHAPQAYALESVKPAAEVWAAESATAEYATAK